MFVIETVMSLTETVRSQTDLVNSVIETVMSVTDTVKSVIDLVKSVIETVISVTETVKSAAQTVISVRETVISHALLRHFSATLPSQRHFWPRANRPKTVSETPRQGQLIIRQKVVILSALKLDNDATVAALL